MAGARGHIQAVVFDLDDTLFLERHYVRSGFAAVASRLRRRLGRRDAFEDWLWEQFLAGRRQRAFNALSEHFGLGLDDRRIAELVECYRTHIPRIAPCPDVPGLLAALRARRLHLAVLSDGYLPTQRLKLAALRLAEPFDAVVFTEELGREAWKPSPRGFQRLAAGLAVAPAACAYVGDNPSKDFLPGNELGWLTVQWRRPGQLHADTAAPPGGAPQAVVRSAGELLTLLDAAGKP